jgi:hypothetical protein
VKHFSREKIAPHPPAGTFSPSKGREKFDFIGDFANRQRRNVGYGGIDSKLLPVLHGEKMPEGR